MDDAALDAALGPRLDWQPVAPPERGALAGACVSLEPLDAERHGSALYRASHGDGSDPALWLYMGRGPWESEDAFMNVLRADETSTDPLFYAVVPTGGDPAGVVSYLRIDAENGVIEIGHIWFGAAMQRSRAATEAIFLLARHAFDDLGYRRLEWKCFAQNARSRRAAERFGFTFEGVFRQARVVRDRNRDTAWYSIIDGEWPAIRAAFETWLADDNFDIEGRQVRSLEEIRNAP